MRKTNATIADDRLLVLALGLAPESRGAPHPSEKLCQLLTRPRVADPPGVRDQRQREPSGDCAARCLADPAPEVCRELTIAVAQRPQPLSRGGSSAGASVTLSSVRAGPCGVVDLDQAGGAATLQVGDPLGEPRRPS